MGVASVRFMESLIFENMSRKHGLAPEVIAFTRGIVSVGGPAKPVNGRAAPDRMRLATTKH